MVASLVMPNTRQRKSVSKLVSADGCKLIDVSLSIKQVLSDVLVSYDSASDRVNYHDRVFLMDNQKSTGSS